MLRRTLFKLAAYPLLSAMPLHAEERNRPLHISTLTRHDPATLIATNIVTEAYRRLNIAVQIDELPGERSLQSADYGTTDGELYRKAGMEVNYPNLIMIPVPLMNYEIVVFTRGARFVVNGWESLRPYTIGFVKSIKVAEDNTRGMKVEVAATLRSAFLKMSLGRSDVVVANRLSGLAMLKELGAGDIKLLEPAITVFPVYHYLNKKHADLVPGISDILSKMQKDKTIERIQKTVIDDSGLE